MAGLQTVLGMMLTGCRPTQMPVLTGLRMVCGWCCGCMETVIADADADTDTDTDADACAWRHSFICIGTNFQQHTHSEQV